MALWPYKDTKFFMKSANFIMLYTGNLVLRYYVGFLQIRPHIMYALGIMVSMVITNGVLII